jgi:hypothetical protein
MIIYLMGIVEFGHEDLDRMFFHRKGCFFMVRSNLKNGGASSPKAFCVVLVLGAYDFLKSRSVHDCFGCFLFRFASMVFIFVFILVGGCVGGREEGT